MFVNDHDVHVKNNVGCYVVVCMVSYVCVRVIFLCNLSGFFYVLYVSLINVRNGSRRVFIVDIMRLL